MRRKHAHEELSRGTVFRPFPIIAEAPYFGDGESSRRSERAERTPAGAQANTKAKARARSGQAFEERPRAADARQGRAAGSAADRPGARGTAQSRHRPGHSGSGFADRAEAAGGQLVRPPRRFFRRAPRAQIDGVRRDAAGGLRRQGSGTVGCDALGRGLRARAGARFRGRRRSGRRRREQERHHDLSRHHRRRLHGASAGNAAARGPPGIRRAAVDAAPPAAAGKIRRRPAAGDPIGFRAQGRSAHRHRRPGRRRAAPGPHPGAAGRHRLRQDLHHGQGDRGDPAARAGARAQQDAGGPALRRVQELLPGQRGRIFRQLLRLLPARGLRASHRHLYREGILDQRADRPHAPQRDARFARARRRHHRGIGVVHLRHRFGRDLFGHDVHPQAGRAHRPAPAHRRSRRAAVQAQRRRLLSRRVPRARRRGRDLSRPLRRPRLARPAVRRRD